MTITLDGRRLETAWWGPAAAAAPSIVLLHEGLGSVSTWQDFPEAVADATGCGVLAYSRFGYGQSDLASLPWPLTYMHEEAALLPRVLDAVGIRHCVLLGHSDGGSIAAIHAGSRQDFSLRGLVLLAPHFFVEDTTLAGIRDARQRWETTNWRDRLAQHHRDPDGVFHGWNDSWLDPGFPAALDLQAELSHIRVPMLIVQGEADPYGTVEQVRLAEREAYCPVEALLLPGIGHAPHREASAPTLAAIREFCVQVFR